jgi:phage shock protein A
MNIWAKMVSALKGEDGSTETNLDAKALDILDNEVRAVSNELKVSKDSLAELMAQRKQTENQIKTAQSAIETHENYALQALDKNDDTLALEVAEKIATLESDRQNLTEIAQEYQHSIKTLQRIIASGDANLRRLKQQVATIKATESVQRAQAAISARHVGQGKRAQTAQASLERLKDRQADKAAEFEALQETNETTKKDALLEKLADAGILTGSSGANEILDRLKKKKKKDN